MARGKNSGGTLHPKKRAIDRYEHILDTQATLEFVEIRHRVIS
jgi:hypothetical protein